jgi:uncharacterized protein YbjQ (UPF0145 family)
MILSTTFDVPGRTIAQNLGVARGNVVRGRSIGRNIVASFRMLVGGEIHEYTKLMAESREQALDRLIEQVSPLGTVTTYAYDGVLPAGLKLDSKTGTISGSYNPQSGGLPGSQARKGLAGGPPNIVGSVPNRVLTQRSPSGAAGQRQPSGKRN